jgi:hypothetical protein
MKTKLFYEQPRVTVLHVHTEGIMVTSGFPIVSFSNSGYGFENDENWNN